MVDTTPLAGGRAVDTARIGDEQAFDELVGALIEPAYRLAVVLLRDAGEAEDAVQEACLKAWRNLGTLRDKAAVRTWFLSIVANQCRSMKRVRWWSVLMRGVLETGAADTGDVEGELDLDREVSHLPDTDRAVLFLFFYLDLPLSEVGRILKISPQAAKSRVHRAVTKLRQSMVEVPK